MEAEYIVTPATSYHVGSLEGKSQHAMRSSACPLAALFCPPPFFFILFSLPSEKSCGSVSTIVLRSSGG